MDIAGVKAEKACAKTESNKKMQKEKIYASKDTTGNTNAVLVLAIHFSHPRGCKLCKLLFLYEVESKKLLFFFFTPYLTSVKTYPQSFDTTFYNYRQLPQ